MFVDRAKIHVAAGNGGSGSASFRREKFVPLGGPDGGDGGNGGSVIIQAVTGEQSLVALRYQPLWKAQSGGNGRGRKMHGVNGEPPRASSFAISTRRMKRSRRPKAAKAASATPTS